MSKKWAWAMVALWMAVIFAMSAMPGDVSGEQSGTVTEILLQVISAVQGEQAAASMDVGLLEHLVRKAAHMAEYAVLFLLSRRALRLSGARRPGLCALMLSAAYAATDEFHQCFTADRGPSPVDVMIDTAGAALAWAFLAVCSRVRARLAGGR